MTVTEFSNEFDILYNGVAANEAPALDLYEKSVYLTKAQLELVKNHFIPRGNKYQEGFEQSSKRRADLRSLITLGSSSLKYFNDNRLSVNSQFFSIPSNVFLIIQESAIVTPNSTCETDVIVSIKPITHDEYNRQKDNPFKQPDKSIIWRVDVGGLQPGANNVELISNHNIEEYKFRYIKYPTPIILTDLDTTFPGESLSIDGNTSNATSSLDKSFHREILDRAVELALVDLYPNKASLKTQINQRNE